MDEVSQMYNRNDNHQGWEVRRLCSGGPVVDLLFLMCGHTKMPACLLCADECSQLFSAV